MTEPAANFEALYDRHIDEIYGYIAFRLAPDTESARDVCQEAFEAALKSIDTLECIDAARAWLFGIARNKIADHLRARIGRNGRLLHSTCVGELADDSARTIEADRQHRATITAAVMQRLTARYATLLEDKYIRTMTVAEMATAHQLTPKAIESGLSRARDAFRREYDALHAQEATTQ
jgi:RNA polymerase sigma-70 factor (ECF subfamily)